MSSRMDAAERAAKARIPTAVVRCIWIVSFFIVLACALLALGVTCYVVGQSAGPCPGTLPVTVFGVAGGLLVVGSVMLMRICRGKKQMKNGHVAALDRKDGDCLADVLELEALAQEGGEISAPPADDVGSATINASGETDFSANEKSADVSYWIEQQRPLEDDLPSDVPETSDGATGVAEDDESVQSEVTAM